MKNRIILLAVIAAMGISCTKETSGTHAPEADALMSKLVGSTASNVEEGAVLVRLDASAADAINSGTSSFNAEGLEITSVVPALGVQPKNKEVARKYGLDRWFRVTFDAGIPVREAAEKLSASPQVKAIQYNSFIEPVKPGRIIPYDGPALTRSSADLPFDDPYLDKQWNLINKGGSGAVAGADVGVKDAWRLTAGDPGIIVAVFDCAVNNIHADLSKAVWVNEAEKNGTSGQDDDGNGYIDDTYGFNFVGANLNKAPVKGNRLDWSKGYGHGTHVGGIIGAVNGNGKGVSSIAGGSGNNDGVRLMSCQIFEGSNGTSDAQSAAAFIYAADNGACIAQCSYGNYNIIRTDDEYINGNEEKKIAGASLENAALLYFMDPSNSNHESLEGNLAVFAAGNHSNPYSCYPGALPYVLSVTAFCRDFMPGSYTNYGPGCKIAAPGGEVIGTSEVSGMILSTGVSNAATQSPAVEGSNGRSDYNYVYMQGTSMACPHVSGVAALGIAYAKKLGKKFTRDEFTSLLLTSVNDIDSYLPDGNKYKGQMGAGAVDAWKFLMSIEGTPSIMVEAGKTSEIDLTEWIGSEVDELQVSIDEASRNSLGVSADPVISKGRIEISCTKVGAGKITVSASVGKDPEMEDGIGKMDFSREFSIVSRQYTTNNGGWL
jgi:subtilisin family serine protease